LKTVKDSRFGFSHERILVGLFSIATGLLLVYLAVLGPLLLGVIRYKTAATAIYQIMGQDLVNLVLLSVLAIVGGIALILKKDFSRFLILSTPLYLIYYVLSYTVGLEWSSTLYSGNSEKYSWHFLFILIASVITLLYALSIFPKSLKPTFRKRPLVAYSAFLTIFLIMFALMWLKEVQEVITTGTTRAYGEVPTAFWLIRYFDLGFTIPLGFISIYLLWTRPEETAAVQFLFYGFFITMIIAVNSMGLTMLVKHDPAFRMADMIVFLSLAVIVFAGFIYILRNYGIIMKGKSGKAAA